MSRIASVPYCGRHAESQKKSFLLKCKRKLSLGRNKQPLRVELELNKQPEICTRKECTLSKVVTQVLWFVLWDFSLDSSLAKRIKQGILLRLLMLPKLTKAQLNLALTTKL
jgi:hypothetical protein